MYDILECIDMSKLEWVLGTIVLLLALGAVSLKFTVFKNTNFLDHNNKKVATPTPTPEIKAEETYKDEAGFSFQYPKNITVTDTTPDSETYYTLLQLEKNGEKGTIGAEVTKNKNLEEWLTKDNQAPENPTLSGATTLDSIKATQYKSAGKIYTISVDQGVLYRIETPLQNDWPQIHDAIVSTFKFDRLETKPSTPKQTAPSDTTYEEEVVVE